MWHSSAHRGAPAGSGEASAVPGVESPAVGRRDRPVGGRSSACRAACNLGLSLHCELQAGIDGSGNNAGGARIQQFGMACALATDRRSTPTMLDIIFIATTVVFF